MGDICTQEIQPEQRTTFQYRLLYNYEGRERVLATFETPTPIDFSPKGISFGSPQSVIGSITSKAIENPEGGFIYRFYLSPEITESINSWFFAINAENIIWFKSIHLNQAKQSQKIRSKVKVSI